MAREFCIPAKPEDLSDDCCTLDVRVSICTELTSLSPQGVEEFAERKLDIRCIPNADNSGLQH